MAQGGLRGGLFLCHIIWVVNRVSMTDNNRPQVVMEREDYDAPLKILKHVTRFISMK